jgi:hypothetical protein
MTAMVYIAVEANDETVCRQKKEIDWEKKRGMEKEEVPKVGIGEKNKFGKRRRALVNGCGSWRELNVMVHYVAIYGCIMEERRRNWRKGGGIGGEE